MSEINHFNVAKSMAPSYTWPHPSYKLWRLPFARLGIPLINLIFPMYFSFYPKPLCTLIISLAPPLRLSKFTYSNKSKRNHVHLAFLSASLTLLSHTLHTHKKSKEKSNHLLLRLSTQRASQPLPLHFPPFLIINLLFFI